MAQTRIRWIDIAKAIAIICMIVGNIVPWGTPVRNFAFSLYMPLLFILEGYTAEKAGSLPELLEQIKRDFWKLIVPYLALHIADTVIGMSMYGVNMDIRVWIEKLLWASGVEIHGHEPIGTIWILNALFWARVLFSIIKYIIPKRFLGMVSILLGAIGYLLAARSNWMILSLDIPLVAMFYLYVGDLLKRKRFFFKEYQGLIVAMATGIWLFFLSQGLYMEMAARYYPRFLLVMAQSIGACICVISFCEWIGKFSGLSGLLGNIENYAVLTIGAHHLSWRIWQLWGHGTFYDCIVNIIFSCLVAISLFHIQKWLTVSRERWEKVFLIIVGLYFIRLYFNTTLFSIPWPQYFDQLLRLAAAVTVSLKFECPGFKKDKRLFFLVPAAVIFMLSSFSNGYLFLWDLAVLTIGAMDIRYDKILKIYCACGTVIFGLAVMGAFTGCIRDLVYSGPRHAFGIEYPTDFAAHVVFLILAVWVLLKWIPYPVTAAVMAGLAYLLYHYCRARCGSIVMGLSVVAVLYVGLTERWGKNRMVKGFSGLIDRLLVVWMPICATVIIKMSMEYTSEDVTMAAINDWVSSRLWLAHKAISEYGIKFFGTAFDMVGGGSETVTRINYNFIDSSYCLILLRYGLAVLLVVCALNVWTAVRSVKTKRRRLLTALALVSIHSVIEHHLLELAYNPFLLMAFADLSPEEDCGSAATDPNAYRERRRVLLAYGAIGAGGLWILFKLLGYGRTIVSLLELNQRDRNYIFILLMLFLLFVGGMVIRHAARLVVKYLGEKTIEKKRVLALAQYSVLLLWAAVGLEGIMRQKADRYVESLENGTRVIESLMEKPDSKTSVYVDDIPELYRREVEGVSSPFLTGAGLFSETDALLITDRSKDLYMLTDEGFLFGELSDQEGVYTNSEEAVKVLESQGIKMVDHYSVKNQVDLPFMAGANQLEFSESGGLLIEGPSKSLIHGPWITLYRGTLLVEYRLKLLESDVETGEIGKLRLSAESGGDVLEEKPINREDFDENGYCVATIEKWIQSREAIEFLLFANEGTSLELEGITYGKVGK